MSAKTFLDGRITLHCGDCLEVVRGLADNSIDSVVTDPPYALVSIVKRFGNENAAALNNHDAAIGRNGPYTRASAGFMGKRWDTGETAFAVEFWAQILRVLKPGGHVAAFGGTRTYHRLACAIEDAGFEIRDSLMWHYGSGFPKSHNVSKGIDKAAGAEREVVGVHHLHGGGRYENVPDSSDAAFNLCRLNAASEIPLTAPATDAARQWEGWGTALKPATEIICLARKPLSEKTVAANVLRWGTGAINVDGCRVEANGEKTGSNGHLGFTPEKGWNANSMPTKGSAPQSMSLGRWPANLCHDGSDEVLAAFPETTSGTWDGKRNTGDSGSAARFFYSAKASKADRAGSKHPTVKPVKLTQWLVRMLTPPGGTVLDPFAGTGTTGAAAFHEGLNAILVEREAEYQADIRRRLSLVLEPDDEPSQPRLTFPEPVKVKQESLL